jgi:flavin reductase (DIM6/NTAB) family NADH-FMN oxidoreductase RutF
MTKQIKEIEVTEAWKPFNLGGTVFVAAELDGDHDIMPASWSMPLDYDKLAVVVDSSHYTRKLMDKTGYFLLALPTKEIVSKLLYLGTHSKNDDAEKVEKSGLEFFNIEGCPVRLPEGCIAWALCEKLPEEHVQKTYDLFLGRIVRAWIDERIMKDGVPQFGKIDSKLSPLPNFGGAVFYELGKQMDI